MILYGHEIKSLTQILALRAEKTPEKTAYIFIPIEGKALSCNFHDVYQ